MDTLAEYTEKSQRIPVKFKRPTTKKLIIMPTNMTRPLPLLVETLELMLSLSFPAGSFSRFLDLLFVVRVGSQLIGFIFFDNLPPVLVLIRDFDQLLSLVDQFSALGDKRNNLLVARRRLYLV